MAGRDFSIGVKFEGDDTSLERTIKTLANSVNKIGPSLISFGKGVLAGGAALGTLKKVIESTEGTSHALERGIATLDGAMQGLFRTIAANQWGTFLSNIKDTAEATRDAKRATQEYAHSLAGGEIKKGELFLALNEARVNAAESSSPEEKAKYLQEAIDKQKQLTDVRVDEVRKRLKIDEDYYQKVTGHDKQYFEYFLSQVPLLAKEYDYYFGENSTVGVMISKRLTDLNYMKSLRPLTSSEKDEYNKMKNLQLVMEDYLAVQNDFSKKGQWDDFVKGIAEMEFTAGEGEKALVRLTKQLEAARKELAKFDKEKVPGMIYKFPGSGTSGFTVPDLIGDKTKTIKDVNDALSFQSKLVQGLEKSFVDMFTTTQGGFRGMVDSFKSSIEMMLTQLAVKAAIYGVLQLLFPASGLAVGAWKGLQKFIGVPGFASGTNFAPGGLALVGERGPELVNLPRGSQVIPNGGFNERLVTRLNGKHIDIVLTRYYNELDVNS